MGKSREFNSIVEGDDDPSGQGEKSYLNILVRLDDTKIAVKRQEYSFEMWFIAIGGLERVWSRVFGIVVGAVTKPLMINSFLGALFLMKNNRDEEDMDDSSDPEAEQYHGHRPAYGHRMNDDLADKNAYILPPGVVVKNLPVEMDSLEIMALFSDKKLMPNNVWREIDDKTKKPTTTAFVEFVKGVTPFGRKHYSDLAC